MIQQLIQRLLRQLGYTITPLRNLQRDPFSVQRSLIQTAAPVVFDVGAHVGRTAQRYRALFPGARLHLFEPTPASFATLQAWCRTDPHAQAYQVAVGERAESATLYRNRFAETNSLLNQTPEAAAYWGADLLAPEDTLPIHTIALDSFCHERGIAQIDILKLDIQGAELQALRGAQTLLQEQRIGVIYVELLLAPTYAGQGRAHEVLAWLDRYHYQLLDLYNPIRQHARVLQVDALFTAADLTVSLPELFTSE